MFNLILAQVPIWVSESFPIIENILLVLVCISALGIIISILLQPSNPDSGNNVITGVSDSYYAKNKRDTKEGRLQKIIIICAIVMVICTVAYLIMYGIYSGVTTA